MSESKNTEERFNNADGTYTVKTIYYKPMDYLSSIKRFDENEKLLNVKFYKDNNFTVLHSTGEMEYSENGSYTVKVILQEPNEFGYLSQIKEYNDHGKLLNIKFYKDNNFTALDSTEEREYSENGSYTVKVILQEPDELGCFSQINEFDKNGNVLNNKFYKDNNFTVLFRTLEREYSENGSYTDKVILQEPDESGCLSQIQERNKNEKLLNAKTYKDNNFTVLLATMERECSENDFYTDKVILQEPDEFGCFSRIQEVDKNGKLLNVKYYKDNNFTVLLRTLEREYSENGSYTAKVIFQEPDEFGCFAQIKEYNDHGILLIVKRYKDNNFTKLKDTTIGIAGVYISLSSLCRTITIIISIIILFIIKVFL